MANKDPKLEKSGTRWRVHYAGWSFWACAPHNTHPDAWTIRGCPEGRGHSGIWFSVPDEQAAKETLMALAEAMGAA